MREWKKLLSLNLALVMLLGTLQPLPVAAEEAAPFVQLEAPQEEPAQEEPAQEEPAQEEVVPLAEITPAEGDTAEPICGTCGDSLTWALDTATGVLTISGEGAMAGCTGSADMPWNGYQSSIVQVQVEAGVTSVGQYAFYNCTALKSVTLPEGLTSIGQYAFYNCIKLETVELPDSLQTIGECAFRYCASLPEVRIGSGIQSIGNHAFYNCDALETVWIDSTKDQVPRYWSAFDSADVIWNFDSGTCADNLTWQIDSKTGILTISGMGKMSSYSWYDYRKVIVQVRIEEGVLSVGNNAFNGCTSLESITLPDGLQTIGNQAFDGCTALESITLPEGLTSIGDGAFDGCTSLASITLLEGLQSIGSSAFYGCTALKSITLPEGLTSIGSSAFNGCTALESITLPEKVTSIGSSAFYDCTALETVELPDSLQTIGEGAFRYCSSLTEVRIGSGIQSIGYRAFYDCSALETVWINNTNGPVSVAGSAFDDHTNVIWAYQGGTCGDSLTWTLDGETGTLTISGEGNMKEYYQRSVPWYDCRTNIARVVIEDGVTSISSYAFYECTALESVTLPSSLENIGYYAFYHCTALESITLPAGLQSIEGYAFKGCTALESVTLPEGLTVIGNEMFTDCTGLKEVLIPKDMTWQTGNILSAGDLTTYEEAATGVFRNCTSLTSVTIEEGVTVIPEAAFYGCAALTEIHLPKSVTTVGQRAFYGCAALEKAYLDNYFLCVQIKDKAFPETTQLIFATEGEGSQTEVARWYVGAYDETDARAVLYVNGTLVISGTGVVSSEPWQSEYSDCILRVEVQEGITSLPYEAFYSCNQLREVTLGPDVERIESRAFAYCTALTTVTGLENVEYIDYYAFRGCTALTEISLGRNLCYLARRAFENCTALTTVHWNVTSLGNYGSNWNVFCNAGTAGEGITLVLGPDVEEIPDYLFFVSANQTGQLKLVRVDGTQAAKLWYIGSFAFQNCAQLTQVELGHGLTQIGDGVFNGCAALTALTLPDTLHWIGRKAFYNSGLTGLTLGTRVGEIGEDAFAGCAEGFTISGYEGTTAQSYAEANDIPFVVLDAPTITIDGVTYSMNEQVETDTWYFDGDLNDPYLWLYNYAGGGITAGGSLSICCDETSVISGTVDVGEHRLNLYGNGKLTIQTDGDCAVKAETVEIDRKDTLILQAGTTALAAKTVILNGEIYLSADGEASDEYDGGSYLRVEPRRWNALFHANGGVWDDQTEDLRTVKCVGAKKLRDISAHVSREGYVLSGWQDAEDSIECRPDDYLPASAADLVLYADWTQEGLSLGGQRYTLTAEAQGEGWHFTPATDDSWAVLELSDGYNAGGIFSTGELEVRISGSVTITGGAAQPALEVMGQLVIDAAEDAVVTIQGGSGAGAIVLWNNASLYNHGEMTIRGGDGGAGVQCDRLEVYNYGNLSVTGGLRSCAVEHLEVCECTGVITLIAGVGASEAISNGWRHNETIKLHGGKNAATAVRTKGPWHAYVRIQPRTIIVQLDANGGALSGASLLSCELPQDENNAFTFSGAGQPIRAGYRFAGWNTRSDGSGQSYTEGQAYAVDGTVDSITLYAQYEESGINAQQTGEGVTLTFAQVPDCQKLMLAVYDRQGRMVECAFGTQEDAQRWEFDLSCRTDVTWKLFYLDDSCAPVAVADHLLMQ